jgi:hypothetical protein
MDYNGVGSALFVAYARTKSTYHQELNSVGLRRFHDAMVCGLAINDLGSVIARTVAVAGRKLK